METTQMTTVPVTELQAGDRVMLTDGGYVIVMSPLWAPYELADNAGQGGLLFVTHARTTTTMQAGTIEVFIVRLDSSVTVL